LQAVFWYLNIWTNKIKLHLKVNGFKMKRLALTVLLISLGFSSLVAQDDRAADRIEHNLKQLGRKIEQIQLLAERYKNQEALKIIQGAREDFNAAINLLQEWKGNRYRLGLLEQARVKYQSANLKADLASRILLFKPAANLLTQLERLIQQAESVAQGSDANDLRYYLNKARNYYKLAQNAFANNRYLRGHEYLKIATYFAEKVISLGRGNKNSDKGTRFEEHHNNIQMLLSRVSLDIDDNDILSELYKNVQEYLRRASNAHSQGNLNRAFSNLQIAERLTYRIIDLSEENSSNSIEQRVEEEYQSLSRYLNTLRNELEREDQQSSILDKAEEFELKACRNIDNQQYQQAETNLKLAQRMALRVSNKISMSGNMHDSGNLQIRMNEIRHLLNLQGSRIEKQQVNSTDILFEQAQEFFRLAEQAFENNHYAMASYYFNITLRILNVNENILKRQAPANLSEETVLQDLDRAEQLINRLKGNESLDTANQAKISALEKLLVRARAAFEHGNYILAKQIVGIIQNQLTNFTS
jgi:hypothetical protein